MADESGTFEPFAALMDSGLIEDEINSSIRLFGLSDKRLFGERQGEFVGKLLGMFPQLTRKAIANQEGAPSVASISKWLNDKVNLSVSSAVRLVRSVLLAAYSDAQVANAGSCERAYIEAGKKFNDVYLLLCKYLKPQTEDAQREHERRMAIHRINEYLDAMDDKSLARMLDEARRAYVYEQAMKKDPLIAATPN